jgi:nitrogen-specific signal transduction histidine kinase
MGIENPIDAAVAPAGGFRERLLVIANEMAAAGVPESADALRGEIETWWVEQQEWEQSLTTLLELHHEINNALVGVRGHAQIMLHGSAASEPKVRDRLEVIIRESGRIEKAAQQVRKISHHLAGSDPASHAA